MDVSPSVQQDVEFGVMQIVDIVLRTARDLARR
jgi:uncharacterized membrane protein